MTRRRRWLALAVAGTFALGMAGVAAVPAQATTVLPCGTTTMAGLTVQVGDVVEFPATCTATLETSASVVVYGTLRMRPADPSVVHTLRFTGVNEASYVGGGDGVTASDVGLWVQDQGVLDAVGSPKAGWNRTGTDPSWLPGDEVRVTPTAVGDYTTFAPFTRGAHVPTVTSPSGRVYAAEVMNLTRNVRIEGTPSGRAHVRISTTAPQTIRYAALRWLGPRKDANGDGYTDPIPGRTGLHWHRMDDASRGSLVEGVVLRDVGGAIALDIHRSHGVTVRDTVIYDTNGSHVGWAMDGSEPTHDTLLDRVLAAGFAPIPWFRGYAVGLIVLANGEGNVIRDSAAVGNRGGPTSAGFLWPEGSLTETAPVWTATDLTAHNNRADGVYVWQNGGGPHTITRFTGYRNGTAGIDHGAYANQYSYVEPVTFGNGVVGVILHAKSTVATRDLFAGGRVDDGMRLTKHNSTLTTTTRMVGTRLGGLTVDQLVNGGRQPMRLDLLDTGLPRSAVTVRTMHADSLVRVRDGTDCWQVTASGVSDIPCWGA